jgi:hypothetical protein
MKGCKIISRISKHSAKAILSLSVGSREKVCFKHSKNNTVALSAQSPQVVLLNC